MTTCIVSLLLLALHHNQFNYKKNGCLKMDQTNAQCGVSQRKAMMSKKRQADVIAAVRKSFREAKRS